MKDFSRRGFMKWLGLTPLAIPVAQKIIEQPAIASTIKLNVPVVSIGATGGSFSFCNADEKGCRLYKSTSVSG